VDHPCGESKHFSLSPLFLQGLQLRIDCIKFLKQEVQPTMFDPLFNKFRIQSVYQINNVEILYVDLTFVAIVIG
jgi:hypothetical protein